MGEKGSKQLWTGPCIGGPLAIPGTTTMGQSRYPKGFLYVDKPNRLAWIYDWSEIDRMFFVRSSTPMSLDLDKMRKTGRERFDWDIRTAEEEVSRVYAGTTGTDQDSR